MGFRTVFYCGGCGWQPALWVCFGGLLKPDLGFQTTFLLVFFVGRAHATAVFRRPLGLARIRGENPRHGRFQTTFAVSAPAVRCV
ncbi:hypothetical protein [Neisseria sicca]|uniref:hypothetical protein n=1 Tax=Neisseria sicca TaxID=490 RepID=UPI0011BCFD2E|nr:hypothetical protein [Neisseria sicca]